MKKIHRQFLTILAVILIPSAVLAQETATSAQIPAVVMPNQNSTSQVGTPVYTAPVGGVIEIPNDGPRDLPDSDAPAAPPITTTIHLPPTELGPSK